MSWRRSAAVARQDLRILRSDPAFLVIMTVMPLVVMAFIKPAFRASLLLNGVSGVNGAEQAVPGTSVMFAFFLLGNLGFGVFREHAWNTWERLRASPASPAEIMMGKIVVPLATLLLQLGVLFGIGGLLFGLHVRGSMLGMILVIGALAVCLVSLGALLLAVCRSVMQLNAATNIGTMVFAGLGGAITPLSVLPAWARTIAPITPSYWAMRGFRSVTLTNGDLGSVALPILVLLSFAAGFAILAGLRFRAEETKISWA
jgi:ABC-2 type transport system permease protein